MILKGKVALVTGGGGVLGRAMAAGLAAEGAQVALMGRTVSRLREAAETINSPDEVLCLPSDVTNRDQLENAREQLLNTCGHIDILVNAAGGNMPGATIMPDQVVWDMDETDFDRVTRLNLQGTVLPSLVFGQTMADQATGGVIVNISSMAAQQAITRVLGYSASKAAIDNFTKWLAVELAQKHEGKIRVNAIAPGFFIADQNRSLLLEADGSLTSRGQTIIANTPLARFGEPEELVSTLLWLCDERSAFVTGVVVPVDGGFSAFSGV